VRPPPPFHGMKVSASNVESAIVRLPVGDFATGAAVGAVVAAVVGAGADVGAGTDVGTTTGADVGAGLGTDVGATVGVACAQPPRNALIKRMSAMIRKIADLFFISSSLSR